MPLPKIPGDYANEGNKAENNFISLSFWKKEIKPSSDWTLDQKLTFCVLFKNSKQAPNYLQDHIQIAANMLKEPESCVSVKADLLSNV